MKDEKYQSPRGMIFVFLSIAIVWAFILPKYLDKKAQDKFAKPLFTHEVPATATMVQQSTAKDDAGGVTAALLLGTNWTEQQLLDYYGDTEYPPFKKDQTVTLAARPLDEASLKALSEAGQREAGQEYWFVYLYSAPQG